MVLSPPLFLGDLTPIELIALRRAAEQCRAAQAEIVEAGGTCVSRLIDGQAGTQPWQHYPAGDVFDPDSHAQFYYHLHPPGERPAGELGHFHTFLRPPGMPPGVRPAPVANVNEQRDPNDALCHLVAIATDEAGEPKRLFTVNRWVTGETWYRGPDVVAMLDQFRVDGPAHAPAVGLWLTALVRLMKPAIVALIAERDRRVDEWQRQHADTVVYDDRRLEVVSQMPLDLPAYLDDVEAALARLRGSGGSRAAR